MVESTKRRLVSGKHKSVRNIIQPDTRNMTKMVDTKSSEEHIPLKHIVMRSDEGIMT